MALLADEEILVSFGFQEDAGAGPCGDLGVDGGQENGALAALHALGDLVVIVELDDEHDGTGGFEVSFELLLAGHIHEEQRTGGLFAVLGLLFAGHAAVDAVRGVLNGDEIRRDALTVEQPLVVEIRQKLLKRGGKPVIPGFIQRHEGLVAPDQLVRFGFGHHHGDGDGEGGAFGGGIELTGQGVHVFHHIPAAPVQLGAPDGEKPQRHQGLGDADPGPQAVSQEVAGNAEHQQCRQDRQLAGLILSGEFLIHVCSHPLSLRGAYRKAYRYLTHFIQ